MRTTGSWSMVFVPVLAMVGMPAAAGEKLDAFREDLADENVQAFAGESFDQLVKKHGVKSFGAVVKAIPYDDLASAFGAATEGDATAAAKHFARGIIKALAALGAEVAVGTGGAAVTPVLASVGAAVLVGVAFDALISESNVDIKDRLKDLAETEAKKTEQEKQKLKFDKEMIAGELVILQADATSLKLSYRELVSNFAQGKITRAEFDKQSAAVLAKHAQVSQGYAKVVDRLKKLAPSGLEAQLASLKERHRVLKAKVDASGGEDHAAYEEMNAVYKEFMRVKKEVDAQRARK